MVPSSTKDPPELRTFAELTRSIAEVKRQRTQLRAKRAAVPKTRAQGSSRNLARSGDTTPEPCRTRFKAPEAMPRRLTYSKYCCVDPDSQREEIINWLQSSTDRQVRAQGARMSELRFALPETLSWLYPGDDLGKPITHVNLGEWHLEESLSDFLAAGKNCLVEIDFAPCLPNYRSVTPWYSCRCSAQDCSYSEDCRQGSCASLFGSAVSDAQLSMVASELGAQLTKLSLAYCQRVTWRGIQTTMRAFGSCLTYLDLSREIGTSSEIEEDDSVARILAAEDRPNLNSLMLNGWTELTDEGLVVIVRAFSRLLALELSQCLCLTDVGVRTILDECTEISELRLGGCPRITGKCFTDANDGAIAADDGYEGQATLVRIRPGLKKLDLGDCTSLHKSTLRWIATCSPLLTEVRIAGSRVNDDGLRALAMAPGLRLRSLDVSGCSALCADGGSAFSVLAQRQGVYLAHLDVRRVTRLTSHAISALFGCSRLLSVRLDHVPSADENAFGGSSQGAAALEDAEALLAATSFQPTSASPVLLPTSVGRSQQATRRSSMSKKNVCRRQIQALTLSDCRKVSASVVTWLAPRLPHLVVLDLNNAGSGGAVTDASMCAIAEHCRLLCELSAARPAPAHGMTRVAVSAAYVTDIALYELGRKLRRLRRLDLSYHSYLVGVGLEKLPRAWPFLRVLKITGWESLDSCGFRFILAAAPNVTHLDASACLLLENNQIKQAAHKYQYTVASNSAHGGIIRPARGAAAYEKRDALLARFWLEDSASTTITCAYRWSRSRQMFARRFAARKITRSIKGYRQRRVDVFRQNFVHLVNFRRLMMRSSALRLQRFLRRMIAMRKHTAAVRIQVLFREKYGRWISAMMDLFHGSATLAQAAWRGRRARINFSIVHLKLAKQYRDEICGDAANPVRTAVTDIGSRHALNGIGQHIADLRSEITNRRGASTKGDGHHTLSLSMSRKRSINVYGEAPRLYKFDTAAITQGRIHAFNTVLWPQPAAKRHQESIGDFDSKLESYAHRAAELERAGDAGDRVSQVPWRSNEEHSSLLASLETARRAQAKRAILLDRASAVSEQIKLEESKRLEIALTLEAEETKRQEQIFKTETSIRLNSASLLCALSRGRAARLEVRELRIEKEVSRLLLAETRRDRAARVVQKRIRGISVRLYLRTCGLGSQLGFTSVQESETGEHEQHGFFVVSPLDDAVERKEKVKTHVLSRVRRDFFRRRSYERQLAIHDRQKLTAKCDIAFERKLASCYVRFVPLDIAQARLVDTSNANQALTQALQVELKALGGLRSGDGLADEEDAVTKQACRRTKEIDIALKSASTRRTHLKYVSEILETCQWWGVEALRYHYRRHRSRAVLTAETSASLEWIEREADTVWKVLEFVRSRRQEIPKETEVANRYLVSWLEDQAARLVSHGVALDAEQEYVLRRDLNQLSNVLDNGEGSGRLVDEVIDSLLLDARYDAEKVGLDLFRIGEDPESESALRALRSATSLKQKQEFLHKTVHLQLRARAEELHASESAEIDQRVVFQRDQQGLRRSKVSLISAALKNKLPDKKHFDRERWFDIYRSQPWLAQQEVDENRRREQRDVKRIQEANMAGIVDQKRKEISEMAETIKDLEARLLEAQSTLADPTASREVKSEAQGFENTSRDKLARLQEDYERRKTSLEHLEQQLAEFQNELEAEEKESKERLAAAKAAKADFERREGDKERKHASTGEQRLREIDVEIQEIVDQDDDSSVSERMLHELESEKLAIKRELSKIEERVRRRKALEAAAKAEAAAEEAAALKKELQAKLRQEKKEEEMIRARKKVAQQEKALAIKAAKKREKAEEEAAARANDVLYHMGLEDPTLRKARPFKTKLREAVRKQITGHETAATAAHESTSMHSSLLRRQKLKIGAVSALRAIQFTVGVEETIEFTEKQSLLATQSLPHFVRLKKTIGLRAQIVVWLEYTLDQDQFVTDIELAATNEQHPLYKIHSRDWQRWTHSKLTHSTPEEPGLVVWTRRRAHATLAISNLEVAYTKKDGEILAEDGYARVCVLSSFGDSTFGDLSVWVKRVNRNARPKFESEETVLQELKQTHKALKARPNDDAAQARKKGIMKRLEKVREDAEYRDKYKKDPLKYAIEFLALTQSELEKWMRYFESIDIDRTGYVTPEQILSFLGLRTDCNFLQQLFMTLGGVGETRLDFGETLKCIGSFCFFQEREIVHYAYKVCDRDDAGSISRDDLLGFLSDLHTESQRGQTTRALKEINLVDGARMNFDDFLDIHQKFPNILHPAFAFQDKIRRKFFGIAFWEKKLRKYMQTNAEIKQNRALNTENTTSQSSSSSLRGGFLPTLMGRRNSTSVK